MTLGEQNVGAKLLMCMWRRAHSCASEGRGTIHRSWRNGGHMGRVKIGW